MVNRIRTGEIGEKHDFTLFFRIFSFWAGGHGNTGQDGKTKGNERIDYSFIFGGREGDLEVLLYISIETCL